MSDPFETPDDPISQMLANPRSRVQRGENDDGTPDGTYWILLNDLFVPAADGEDIPPDEFPEVLRRWRTRGWWGILDWVIQRRYVSGVRAAPREPSPDFAELITAARFALKECEEITTCYPNAGDFWGLANNAAEELRRALAGEAVSAFAKAVVAPQPPVDVERLNRAVDTMMEQAKNLREVLAGRGAGHP